MAISLSINGEQRQFAAVLSIQQLLDELGLDARKVALERNLEIVPKSAYQGTRLAEGDCIEIVHFIGGGAAGGDHQNEGAFVAHEGMVDGAGEIRAGHQRHGIDR